MPDKDSTSRPTAGRGARRRERTRARLLAAAQRVMARKGLDATTIQDITEEADVGFGSFYNHFESKEAIIDTMMAEAEEAFAGTLDQMTNVLDDPAEVVAASIRHLMQRVIDEPDWGWFLIHTGLSPSHLRTGLGARLARDIRIGMEARRLRIEDPQATFFAVVGTVLGLMAALLDGAIESEAPERAATFALRLLGIPDHEAAEIARRPLPPLESARRVFPG